MIQANNNEINFNGNVILNSGKAKTAAQLRSRLQLVMRLIIAILSFMGLK